MLRTALILSALLIAPLAAAQSPCSAEEANTLDFWVGEWDLTWPPADNDTGQGTNTITKEHDGCVVHERFDSEAGFTGESVSVYNPRAGEWRQTWVDNQGGYLLFTGAPSDDAMELRTAPVTNPQGQEMVSRMTWKNVTADALDWHWQRSTDGGATWTDLWVIRYTRR